MFPLAPFLRAPALPPWCSDPSRCCNPCWQPSVFDPTLRHGIQQRPAPTSAPARSEEHTSELQSPCNLVCRLLLEKKKNTLDHTQPHRPKRPLHLRSRDGALFVFPACINIYTSLRRATSWARELRDAIATDRLRVI